MATMMSYYHKPRPNPLENRKVFEFLDENASKIPDKELLVFFDECSKRSHLSFKEFNDRTRSFAAALAEQGISRGDTVLICAPNCHEYAIAILALSRIGACALLISPSDLTEGMENLLRKLKCEGVILGLEVESKERERAIEVLKGLVALNTVQNNFLKVVALIVGDEKTKPTIQHGNVFTFEELLKKGSHMDKSALDELQRNVDSEDLLFAVSSSGTTGQRKATGYTHHCIVNAINLDVHGGFEEDSVTFSGWPLSWASEIPAFIAAIMVGFTFITAPFSKVTPEDSYDFMLKIIEKEKCDDCSIPQQDVAKLLSENFQDKYDLSSVESFGYGGQFVPRKTVRSLLNAFPSKFATLLYASTEALLVGLQPLSKESIDNSDDFGKMFIMPDTEVKVVDEEGLVVPLGTKGEICVRGLNIFKEYLGNPEETSRMKTKSGWLFTKDYGIMYEGGKLKLLGRKSDIILRGDTKLFPIEFEDILQEHPDVSAAIVVGVPDEVLKKELCACVIEVPGSNLKARVAELEKWCNKEFSKSPDIKGLVPKYFVFMEEFPIKARSKIHRFAIEQFAADKLGLQ